MTKEELTEVVEIIYAMWNKELPNLPDSQKNIYRAWHRILADTPKDAILQAADRLAIREQFLPPPGMIKAEYLRHLPDAPPTAAQAWNEYIRIRDSVNAGTMDTGTTIHPRLQAVIQQVGLSLHTNDDRRHFTETYSATVGS